jgi:hypothetical protein
MKVSFGVELLSLAAMTDRTNLSTSCNVDKSGRSSHLEASKEVCQLASTTREISK